MLGVIVFLHWPPPLQNPIADFLVPFFMRGEWSPTLLYGLMGGIGGGFLILVVCSTITLLCVSLSFSFGGKRKIIGIGCVLLIAASIVFTASRFPTPRSFETELTLAEIHKTLGNVAGARRAYNEALSMNPSIEIRQHIEKQLRELGAGE